MKVLVTGGTGFIGSHLIDRLIADNHSVRCVVRRTSDRRWLAGKPLDLIPCDRVWDPGVAREAVRGVEVVFHLLGTLTAPNLEAFRQVNVRPVRMFLDACLEQGRVRRFVLVGSQGAAGPTSHPDVRLAETDPCRPVSAYGRSKLEAELVTREYQGRVPYTILRLSAVYGPRDASVLTIFKSAYRWGMVPQVGRQSKSLSLAHVRDVARGIWLASAAGKAVDQTYFLSSEEIYSFEDLRAALEAAMNRPVKVRVVPVPVVQALMLYADFLSKVFGKNILLDRDRLTTLSYPHWVCDVSKARADLGYRQTVALKDGFRETFEWYRKQGWL